MNFLDKIKKIKAKKKAEGSDILGLINEITSVLEEVLEIKDKLIEKTKEVESFLKKIPKGDQGPEGKQGLPGKPADDIEEVVSRLLPRVLSKVPKPRDGMDADNEYIIEVLSKKLPTPKNGYTPKKNLDYFDGIQGEPGKDGSPDTPNQVVTKINSADKKIELSAIGGLKELIENVKRSGNGSSGGGGMGNVTHQHTSVSSATTTVTTTSRIAGGGFAVFFFLNGQFLARGTDYTVGTDQKTITLAFTPQDGSVVDIIYFRG